MTIRAPRSTEQAIALLERHAALEGELAAIEANRAQALAATNAVADALAMPLIDELAAIVGKLKPWWAKAAPELTKGKRKSVELGGCHIGTRSGRASLTIAGDEDAVVTVMRTLRWAKPFVRTKFSIDRAATLKAIDGKHAGALAQLGFAKSDGTAIFFVERIVAGAADTVQR